MTNYKAIKITNPLYVGEIAPLVQKFFARMNESTTLHGVSYETIYTYLTQIVQHGKDQAELWVVFDDKEPIAFALWRVLIIPHYGKVTCDYIYKTIKDHKPVELLGQEFLKFGEKHRAVYYQFEAINEPQARLFIKTMGKMGIELEKTSFVNLIGRKKNGK